MPGPAPLRNPFDPTFRADPYPFHDLLRSTAPVDRMPSGQTVPAKLEATVAITHLIRRFDEIDLAAEPHWRDRLTIRGVDRMPPAVR